MSPDDLWLHLNNIKAVFNKDGTTTLHAPGHPSRTFSSKVSFSNAAIVYRKQIDKVNKATKELGYG